MLRSYWLPAIALGLILTGQVQAQTARNDARGQSSTAHSSAKPKSDTPPAVPVSVQNDIHSIARALEAANQKQPSSEEKRDAGQNLRDQNRMAFWAGAMFWVGFAEMLITSLGVILVWRTLRATWAAKNEAKRAADAAHATVASMEDTAKRQLRAYIGTSNGRSAAETVGEGHVFEFEVLFKNTGATPAQNVSHVMRINKVVPPLPPDCDYSISVPGNHSVTTVIPQQEIGLSNTIIVTNVENAEILLGALQLHVFGQASYDDIFGEPHTANFSFLIKVARGNAVWVRTHEHNTCD
jgi:hypothetical protein